MNSVVLLIAAFELVYVEQIASIFFFVLFLLVILRLLLMSSKESTRASRLPLEDDDAPRTEPHAHCQRPTANSSDSQGYSSNDHGLELEKGTHS